MKERTIVFIIILFALSVVAGACAPQSIFEEPEPSAGQPLQVTVSILPQAYFIERIAGDMVAANVMVGPGDDAHTYEPKPNQMIALSESALFFSIGMEYEEAWLPRFEETNPEMEIVDSAEGIERIMETTPHTNNDEAHAQETDDHDEDDNYENQHTDELGYDPHVWLSPVNGKTIASNIYQALVKASPENEPYFSTNYEALIADIDALNSRITVALSDSTQRNFMVYHPAWGYFADAYGLTQIPIQFGGTDPSASELASLIDFALDENIRVLFVQPSFNPANARMIAQEINGEVVLIDPLAREWLTNMELVANALASAMANE